MKNYSRVLAGFMTAALAVTSLTGCGGAKKGSSSSDGNKPAAEAWNFDAGTYADKSTEIYKQVLGDFDDEYEQALTETNKSQSWAEMAVAEAKLLESGTFIPLKSHGGAYSVQRVVPYSSSTVMYGSDMNRYHNRIVTTDLIRKEDRVALKEYWAAHHGDGTYDDYAKQYLTGKGYTIKDEYNMGYVSDPVTWDVLATSREGDSDAIVNTYDGLYEYDDENIQQPMLAESYEVSDDGLTYTFHLRNGVKWVDSQGREIADVTADDFVAGMQHCLDAAGGLEYLLGAGGAGIVGADDYTSGKISDFSQVGVKAVDDHTLQYTLEAPCSYFMTMLGYSVFAPMCRSYYTSQGGKFGDEYDAEAADYTYGTDSDHIAYCGPYLVTNATQSTTIVFDQNPTYWNAANLQNKKITWLFNDGTDATKSYNDTIAGTIDGANLNTSTIEAAKSDGNFDLYADTTNTDATTFNAFFNVWRNKFANASDAKTAVSKQTVAEAELTNTAMLNVHFRRALATALDRASYNAQTAGEDCKYNAMRNSFTPGNFVTLEEDATVKIGDTDTTFPAGTNYGEIVQAQLDADNIPIKAYDKTADDGAGSSDGYDGWYNPDYSKSEMEEALKELKDDGVTIDADHKVKLDLPCLANDETYKNQANVLKQSIENLLGDYVEVTLVDCDTADDWYNAGYQCQTGSDMNFNIYDAAGWGPDYGDPRSYLGTMTPDGNGYMTKCIGVF